MRIWDWHKTDNDVCFNIDIEKDKLHKADIGPLTLWLKKTEDEILVAAQRISYSANTAFDQPQAVIADSSAQSEPLSWCRWVVGSDCSGVRLSPVLPDRSLIVRPETPLKLPGGHKALFYVSVSAWVKITALDSGKTALKEEPTVELSNIWYGDPTAGELCYSLKTTARRTLRDIVPYPHRIICPVEIINKTKSELNIVRFCLQSNYLNIYAGSTMMWTNNVKMQFEGDVLENNIAYTQTPFEIEPQAKLITPARLQYKETIFKRGLDNFKFFGGN